VDRIKAGLEKVLADWQRAGKKAKAYEDKLIPRAKKTLDATLIAYKNGLAGFSTLFQAEVQLLQFERTLRKSMIQTKIAKALITKLSGNL